MMQEVCRYITVVIPTYNSEKTLPLVLKALVEIEYEKEKIKVVIVDDNSADNTWCIALDFKEKYESMFNQVEVVRLNEKVTTSKARNEGIKKAMPSSCIFFLDSDVIPNPTTLRELMELLTDPCVGAVGKLYLTKNPSLFEKSMWFRYLGKIKEGPAGTGALLVKPEVIERVGLFNEKLGYPKTIYEDLEYVMRIRRAGYRVLIDGRNPLLHYKPLTQDAVSKHKALGTLRQIMKHFLTYISPSKAYALYNVLRAAPWKYKLEYIMYILIIVALGVSVALKFVLLMAALIVLPMLLAAIYYLNEYKHSLPLHLSIASGMIVLISRMIRAFALLIYSPIIPLLARKLYEKMG